MDCDKDNPASAKTIQALGGELIREYFCDKDGCIVQDYKIDVDKALTDYKGQYETT